MNVLLTSSTNREVQRLPSAGFVFILVTGQEEIRSNQVKKRAMQQEVIYTRDLDKAKKTSN